MAGRPLRRARIARNNSSSHAIRLPRDDDPQPGSMTVEELARLCRSPEAVIDAEGYTAYGYWILAALVRGGLKREGSGFAKTTFQEFADQCAASPNFYTTRFPKDGY